eukprot:361560-Chlamydomonas_euryale.AAC.1
MACLSEVLSTRAAVPGLAAYFRAEAAGAGAAAEVVGGACVGATAELAVRARARGAEEGAGSSASTGVGTGASSASPRPAAGARPALTPELLACASSRHAVLREKALSALRGLAGNYPHALCAGASTADAATAAAEPQAVVPGAGVGGGGAWSAGARPPASGVLTASTSSSAPPAPYSTAHALSRCWGRLLAAAAHSLEVSCSESPSGRAPSQPPQQQQQRLRSPRVSGGGAAPGNTSAATSADDKAAQVASQMLGAALRGAADLLGLQDVACGGGNADGDSGEPRDAGSEAGATLAHGGDDGSGDAAAAAGAMQLLHGFWVGARRVLVPMATSSHSYMVRSAALTALATLPRLLARGGGSGGDGDGCGSGNGDAQLEVAELVALLASAATGDEVPAVRAAACRALGALLPPLLLLRRAGAAAAAAPEARDVDGGGATAVAATNGATALSSGGAFAASGGGGSGGARALVACLGNPVVSVRIAASWGLAEVCAALHGVAGAARRARARAHSAAGGKASGGGGGEVATAGLVAHLADAALLTMRDVEKVRANGVRALGSLLAIAPAPRCDAAGGAAAAERHSAEVGKADGDADWLRRAVDDLQSCLTTGNVSVSGGSGGCGLH